MEIVVFQKTNKNLEARATNPVIWHTPDSPSNGEENQIPVNYTIEDDIIIQPPHSPKNQVKLVNKLIFEDDIVTPYENTESKKTKMKRVTMEHKHELMKLKRDGGCSIKIKDEYECPVRMNIIHFFKECLLL